MRAQIFERRAQLEPYLGAWDALAVAASRPFCAPGWLVPWWVHVAAEEAKLHVVAVFEQDQLIGLAPWYLAPAAFGVRVIRPLGTRTSHRVEPLAAPGHEKDVAIAIAETVFQAPARPDLLSFEGIDIRHGWPALLADAWPGRGATTIRTAEDRAPYLMLDAPDFETWLAGKGPHFRGDLRNRRNRFVRRGGRFRLASHQTLDTDLRAFGNLHRGRWVGRGGSGVLTKPVEKMLVDAARRLLEQGRLRLWSLEIDDAIISSHLAVTAGTEYGYWLTGFDERYAKLSPSILGALKIVEDAFSCGAARLDFSHGDAAYKRRFTDTDAALVWTTVLPRGPRQPLARLCVAASALRRLRQKAAKRLRSS